MLYKIMLVDDEAEVRLSILNRIPWHKLGFEVIADAENGEDALEKMMTAEPDVIITDIQMPFMSGLEFIAKVRENYPDKEIVIFSGYSEFEYAKQAIRLGVREYILKPVDREELSAILTKIKHDLDDQLAQMRDTQAIYEQFQKTYSASKEQFFRRWIKTAPNAPETDALLDEYGIRDKKANRWLGCCIRISEAGQQAPDSLRLHIEKLLANVLSDSFSYDLFSLEEETGVCFYLQKDQELKHLFTLFNRIVRDAMRLFGWTATIGVGTEKTALEQLPASLREAKEALAYGILVGYGRTLYIQDVEPAEAQTLLFGSEEENRLIHAVKFEPEEQLSKTLKQLLDQTDRTHISWRQYQSYILELFQSLQQMIWKYGMDERKLFGYGEDGHEILIHLKTREEIYRFFTELCRNIRACFEKKREDDLGHIVNMAKDYVEKNYADETLSVETICEHLNLSQSYFSTVFKRKTGQNYVTYVREIRMKQAAELLNRTEDKTYVIARKVGYADPYYFSSIFKKTYGVSPSRFRKNVQ